MRSPLAHLSHCFVDDRLAQKQKKPSLEGFFVFQPKLILVAGAGFEPTTFGL